MRNPRVPSECCSSFNRSRSKPSEPVRAVDLPAECVLAAGGKPCRLDRADRAVGEARHSFERVVDLPPGKERACLGGRRGDLTNQIAREVDHMRPEVAERTRACSVSVEAPGVVGRRPPLLQVPTAEVEDLPSSPASIRPAPAASVLERLDRRGNSSTSSALADLHELILRIAYGAVPGRNCLPFQHDAWLACRVCSGPACWKELLDMQSPSHSHTGPLTLRPLEHGNMVGAGIHLLRHQHSSGTSMMAWARLGVCVWQKAPPISTFSSHAPP